MTENYNHFIKKSYYLILACMIIGAFALTACSVDITINNPNMNKKEATEAEMNEAEDNPADIEEMIIGKWILADRDGNPVTTNDKGVYNFISTSKAYLNASYNPVNEVEARWIDSDEFDVVISGSKLTLTGHPEENVTVTHELTIIEIDDNEFTAKVNVSTTVDGDDLFSHENLDRYVKVNDDFSEEILGIWEGRCMSEGSVFDDGQDHRWEYKADGTYVYYVKDGDDWIPSDNTLNEYFVAGNLLCTRWINDDEESREWWEITIDGDKMNWTALRKDEDGNTFTAEFEMTRVESEELNVAEQIIGKWMVADRDGNPSITNRKLVITFVSDSKAYVSGSFIPPSQEFNVWVDNTEADVVNSGNKLTLTGHPEANVMVTNELNIKDIKDDEFIANDKVTITLDGKEVSSLENVVRFVKVNEDFSKDIFGTWEGRCTSEKSVFDDGQDHRWTFNDDGTLVYYVIDGDSWVPGEYPSGEYFVAGNLLCSRWMEGDEENREWWEIAIDGDKMNWTALREDEDGETYTATFEMTRVEE